MHASSNENPKSDEGKLLSPPTHAPQIQQTNRNETKDIQTMKKFALLLSVASSAVVATEAFAPHTSARWRQVAKQHQIVAVKRTMTPPPPSRPAFLTRRRITLYGRRTDAAFDAHDCPDPGMEAAAEERAVMMAESTAESMHLQPKHLIHAEQTPDDSIPAPQISKDEVDDAEIEQALEDAAYDAHDCSDAGMEAAAEERAVMNAYEMAEKKKEEAREQGS